MSDEHVPGIEVGRGRDAQERALDLAVGVALPVGFRLVAEQDRLVITRRARPRTLRYLAPFTLALDAAVAAYALLLSGSPADIPLLFSLGIYLLPIAFLNYLTLAGLLNHTRVTVDDRGVRVQHRPLALPSARRPMTSADVEELVIEDDGFFTASRVKVPQWRVAARLRGWQTPVVLVAGLPEREQAEHVVRQMSAYLGLS